MKFNYFLILDLTSIIITMLGACEYNNLLKLFKKGGDNIITEPPNY